MSRVDVGRENAGRLDYDNYRWSQKLSGPGKKQTLLDQSLPKLRL